MLTPDFLTDVLESIINTPVEDMDGSTIIDYFLSFAPEEIRNASREVGIG